MWNSGLRIKNKVMNAFTKKTLFTLFLCSAIMMPISQARADVWYAWLLNANMTVTLQEISRRIEGITLSVLKQQVIMLIHKKVASIINKSGTGGSSLVIQNWQNFIFVQASKKAEAEINNYFFPDLFGGKGSTANYVPKSEAFATNRYGSYPEYLQSIGEKELTKLAGKTAKYTLDQICPDPQSALDKGDYRCFAALLDPDKPENSPYGIPLVVSEEFQKIKNQQETIATTQAGISGYKPKTDGRGTVVTPPSTVSTIVDETITAPLKTIISADNSSEISSFIQAALYSFMYAAIQEGVAQAVAYVDQRTGIQGLGSQLILAGDADYGNNIGAQYTSSSDTVNSNNVGSSASQDDICQKNCVDLGTKQ